MTAVAQRPARKTRSRANSEATADAIARAAEDAAADGQRTSITAERQQAIKRATRKDVLSVVKELSPEFLHCRDYGHQWRQTAPRREGKLRMRTMYCPSCKYQKHQTLDSHGDVIEEKPDYPEGYRIVGLGRIMKDTKGIVRIASIDAAIDAAEQKAAKTAARKKVS